MNLKSKMSFNIKRHKPIVIGFSIFLAVVLQLVIVNINKTSLKEETVPVLIAKQEIKDGITITNDMYEKVNIRPIKGQDYLGEDELDKYKTSTKILKGESITKGRLRELGLEDEEKKVSYSIKLDPSDAVAGRLKRGDKVNIVSAVAGNGSGVAQYLFEESPNVPKDIKVSEVYDANSTTITDSSIPASTIVLELDAEQVPSLRVAELAQNVKLVLSANQ